MDQKPTHFDGSGKLNFEPNVKTDNERFHITDEIRVQISGNPYINE
ncbi:hypothetical protein [Sediminibacillus massiliensis]|nr:hypothetical protein [Sediminibacillus massiliensis]